MRILESDAEIRSKILTALLPEIESTLNRSLPRITDQIRELVIKAIQSEPEYTSLISGKLKIELGIPDAATKIVEILDIWQKNIDVQFNPLKITNYGINGGFSINMIKADFQDVLSSNGAQITDDMRGYSLPWLDWLLLQGGNIIVKEHKIIIGASRFSRTGEAIMRSDIASNWRVPEEFAGTINNNWITRAISRIDQEVEKLIQNVIESSIS